MNTGVLCVQRTDMETFSDRYCSGLINTRGKGIPRHYFPTSAVYIVIDGIKRFYISLILVLRDTFRLGILSIYGLPSFMYGCFLSRH